jgi:hypothetical protein
MVQAMHVARAQVQFVDTTTAAFLTEPDDDDDMRDAAAGVDDGPSDGALSDTDGDSDGSDDDKYFTAAPAGFSSRTNVQHRLAGGGGGAGGSSGSAMCVCFAAQPRAAAWKRHACLCPEFPACMQSLLGPCG